MSFRFARITLADLNIRIKNEMNEFYLPSYEHLFHNVTSLNANTVEVVDYVGRTWILERHSMFFTAPTVRRINGLAPNTSHLAWNPSLSAAKWLQQIIETN
jgi:hypothetical protein